MGKMILDRVVQLLSDSGIRAETAYPAERISRITEPVAAVSLKEADQKAHTVTVLVEILGPKEGGGYVCQKKALEVCAVLEKAGGVCCQESCDFISRGNVFRVPIRVTFRGTARSDDMEKMPEFKIVTGTLTLDHACGFSAEQVLDPTVTLLQDAPWKFTVEEFFPWGILDTLETETPFTLELQSLGNVERFTGCAWTSRKRIAEELGIRQIRTGEAKKRFITSN